MPTFHALKSERGSGGMFWSFCPQNRPRWGGKQQAGGEAGRGAPQSGQDGIPLAAVWAGECIFNSGF